MSSFPVLPPTRRMMKTFFLLLINVVALCQWNSTNSIQHRDEREMSNESRLLSRIIVDDCENFHSFSSSPAEMLSILFFSFPARFSHGKFATSSSKKREKLLGKPRKFSPALLTLLNQKKFNKEKSSRPLFHLWFRWVEGVGACKSL